MDILTINGDIGRYPQSYYAATAHAFQAAPAPEGEIRCDVCIIGGGFTGVSSALHLAKRGYKVVLLEANRIGWGASGRNGGQVNTGMRLDQPLLEAKYGRDTAHRLWAVATQAVDLVKGLIAEHKIDCDFKPGVIHASHRAGDGWHFAELVEAMGENYGVTSMELLDREALHALLPTDFYCSGLLDRDAGHLHPLNYLFGLAQAAQVHGAALHENARVVEIVKGSPAIVKTDRATIRAGHVVVGVNGYGGRLVGEDAPYVMPINAYIGTTRVLTEDEAARVLTQDYAVADSKFVINYFRLTQDRRLLFGGGESYGYRFPRDLDGIVRRPMAQVFPHLRDVPFDYRWGGTLGITMSRMPHFRRLAGNVLTAGGFSGQGVALATLSGQVIADAVAGQAERFDLMASLPAVPFPGGTAMRLPLLVLAMTWYALRDRLG
ncbi:MAG TPA: FAD-binding oxidoreductase [Ensifer sp.]|nr:FAD-binding oxidoreductase [Ensifer sp.]